MPSISYPSFNYVKIHKLDSNLVNNDISLGQATRLRIKYTALSDYVTIGNILTISEYPTYFLYKVSSLGSNTADNYIKDYKFSGSIVTTFGTSVLDFTPIQLTESIDNANIYTSSSGFFTYSNTPNVAIHFTASFTGKGLFPSSVYLNFFFDGLNDTVYNIPFFPGSASPAQTKTITGSIFPLKNSPFTISVFAPFMTINNVQFQFTQSIAPSSQEYDSVIIEPYITEPNFYNSDNNALLNSVNDQRENTFALDADYGYGTTPTNFDALINGIATPSTTPDSNYTSKKSTLLKYEGSKSTSKLLNQWTEGDTGTYGQLPTVENLKTYIAYCDNGSFGGISGMPPEYENSSAMFVKYLINADGTVVIPNTSKDSLSIMQQTFLTGERVFISSKGGTSLDSYRTVIRGGSHIEPILYSQSGSLPNIKWNTTMSFEDMVLSPGGAVSNYSTAYSRIAPNTDYTGAAGSEQIITFDNTVYGTTLVSNGYKVPANLVNEGINLTFNLSLKVNTIFDWPFGPNTYTANFQNYEILLYNTTTGQLVSAQMTGNGQNTTIPGDLFFSHTINNSNLTTGDEYKFYIKYFKTGNNYINQNANYIAGFRIINNSQKITINQYPTFTKPVTSSGANSIWQWGNKTTYPYIITSSNTTLTQLYKNPNVKAKDITNSGFNTIQVPWEIKIGDEFKFEGREDWSYMVKKVYTPLESGSGRVFKTGSIEVHFNKNLPIAAASTVFNLDHFLIRRYVDDAGQNLITGFKPPGSQGPYIIKPEFIVPELNKDIDEILLDLTQKGLIT